MRFGGETPGARLYHTVCPGFTGSRRVFGVGFVLGGRVGEGLIIVLFIASAVPA